MNEFYGSRIGGKVIPDVENNLSSKSKGWKVWVMCEMYQIVYFDWHEG